MTPTPADTRPTAPAVLEFLWDIVEEYLDTLSDDDGEEIYASYRDHAEDELEKFLGWLESKSQPRRLPTVPVPIQRPRTTPENDSL